MLPESSPNYSWKLGAVSIAPKRESKPGHTADCSDVSQNFAPAESASGHKGHFFNREGQFATTVIGVCDASSRGLNRRKRRASGVTSCFVPLASRSASTENTERISVFSVSFSRGQSDDLWSRLSRPVNFTSAGSDAAVPPLDEEYTIMCRVGLQPGLLFVLAGGQDIHDAEPRKHSKNLYRQ